MNATDLESFGAMLLWLVPFVAGKHLPWGTAAHPRRWVSAAAGIAIAYVFVDLLPEMSRMQAAFTVAAEGRGYPLPEFRVYFSALLGFTVFYSLQNMAGAAQTQEPDEEGKTFFYRADVWGFAGYCGLMSYLLAADARKSSLSLVLYTSAMFLHFWLVDHSLRREHPEPYDRSGRWIIVSGILLGWLVGVVQLSSDVIVPTLMGFIAGGVVINSLRAELPEKREGRLLPFVTGAFGYALLLGLIELAEKARQAGASPH